MAFLDRILEWVVNQLMGVRLWIFYRKYKREQEQKISDAQKLSDLTSEYLVYDEREPREENQRIH